MNMSYSTKVPGSHSRPILSLAVSLPFLCWAAILFSPPPSKAAARADSILCFTLEIRLKIYHYYFSTHLRVC